MLSDLLMRLRALFRRNAVENDLNDEVRFHFDQQVEKLIQAGVPLTEARRRAAVAFGGTEQVKDECRDARGTRFLETLVQDVRYGARLLKHNPGMTATVGLTLALIIGANAAVFSVVKAVLLQDLPFPKPEQLVLLWGTSEVFGPRSQISFTDMSDWRRDADSLDEVRPFRAGGIPPSTWTTGQST